MSDTDYDESLDYDEELFPDDYSGIKCEICFYINDNDEEYCQSCGTKL